MHNQLAWLHVRSRINYSLIKFLNRIITKAPEIIYRSLTFFSDVHFIPIPLVSQVMGVSCYLPVKQINFKEHRVIEQWWHGTCS